MRLGIKNIKIMPGCSILLAFHNNQVKAMQVIARFFAAGLKQDRRDKCLIFGSKAYAELFSQSMAAEEIDMQQVADSFTAISDEWNIFTDGDYSENQAIESLHNFIKKTKEANNLARIVIDMDWLASCFPDENLLKLEKRMVGLLNLPTTPALSIFVHKVVPDSMVALLNLHPIVVDDDAGININQHHRVI